MFLGYYADYCEVLFMKILYIYVENRGRDINRGLLIKIIKRWLIPHFVIKYGFVYRESYVQIDRVALIHVV
jgi:hypothetical protein